MIGYGNGMAATTFCIMLFVTEPVIASATPCENLAKLTTTEQLICLDEQVRDAKASINRLTREIIEKLSKSPPSEGLFNNRWAKLLRAESIATISLSEAKCEKEFLEGGATSSGKIERRSCELEILSDHELFLKTAYFKK
jgi:uncharacterized protein YecT (DUF1311 family)